MQDASQGTKAQVKAKKNKDTKKRTFTWRSLAELFFTTKGVQTTKANLSKAIGEERGRDQIAYRIHQLQQGLIPSFSLSLSFPSVHCLLSVYVGVCAFLFLLSFVVLRYPTIPNPPPSICIHIHIVIHSPTPTTNSPLELAYYSLLSLSLCTFPLPPPSFTHTFSSFLLPFLPSHLLSPAPPLLFFTFDSTLLPPPSLSFFLTSHSSYFPLNFTTTQKKMEPYQQFRLGTRIEALAVRRDVKRDYFYNRLSDIQHYFPTAWGFKVNSINILFLEDEHEQW